jgi:hypothetical protein
VRARLHHRRRLLAKEPQVGDDRRQLERGQGVDQLARLPAQRLGGALAAGADGLLERHVGLGRLLGVAPRGELAERDVLPVEPAVDVDVQEVGAVGEPPVALHGVRQEHVLEAAERSLAVDGEHQALAQRFVLHRGHEPLHPAVLLARRGRVEVDEAAFGAADELALLLVLGSAVDDGHHLSGLEVQVAVGLGGVVLEGGLEGRPIWFGGIDYDSHR